MATAATTAHSDRRRAVEARLGALSRPWPDRRALPPDGRVTTTEWPLPALQAALVDLGTLWAAFGVYLGGRPDLLPRRDCEALACTPVAGREMPPPVVRARVSAALGRPLDQRFYQFDLTPSRVTPWTQVHEAWLAPGVPVTVTVVRDDIETVLQECALLPLLAPWLQLDATVLAAAVADFSGLLTRQVDQTAVAAALTTLEADRERRGGFRAPRCYPQECARAVLTAERVQATTLAALEAGASPQGTARDEDRTRVARRLSAAWWQQALYGRVVPVAWSAADVAVQGDDCLLLGGVCEAQSSAERQALLRYARAVMQDDPDAASEWLVDPAAAEGPVAVEDALRRRLRQAVPFRDGEWTGEDRFAEQCVVHGRIAAEVRWSLSPHRRRLLQAVYRLDRSLLRLAPQADACADGLQDVRMRAGIDDARHWATPRAALGLLQRGAAGVMGMPGRVDDLLTRASEGRLRVRLAVPDTDAASQTRRQTVLLVAALALLIGLVSVARHVAPMMGGAAERVLAVAVLLAGGWLLVGAARL